MLTLSGGHIGGDTPVLIPNTEVKPSRADDTAWGTAWESRTPPELFYKAPVGEILQGLFVFNATISSEFCPMIWLANWPKKA